MDQLILFRESLQEFALFDMFLFYAGSIDECSQFCPWCSRFLGDGAWMLLDLGLSCILSIVSPSHPPEFDNIVQIGDYIYSSYKKSIEMKKVDKKITMIFDFGKTLIIGDH